MESIETPRLTLRNFRAEDAEDLFAYLREPSVSCFLSMKLDDMDAAKAEAERRSQSDEYIAVCLSGTDKLIGDLFAVPEDDTVSVGWNFNPAFSGTGLASEAARALFQWLFSVKQARRLYAYVEDNNIPSQRLCERLGMRREGLFMEYVSFRNGDDDLPIYENTMQYAILRKEWDARIGSVAG